jgi:sugar phosphate isomerase/epimerase
MFPSFNARAAGLTLSAVETIDLAASAGFAGVDLLVRDLILAGDDPKSLRQRMDDVGLVGGAFPLPVSWRGDRATYLRDLAELPRLADTASILGLRRTGTWLLPEVPTDLDRESALEFQLDRVGAIAEILGRYGIRIGLETIGVARSRTGRTARLFTRQSDLGPILAPLAKAHRNVCQLLDTFHLYAASETLDEALPTGIGPLVWVHVADLPDDATGDRDKIVDEFRGLPGEHGAVDNVAALKALADRGYDGPVTAEPLGQCRALTGLQPAAAALAIAQALRSVWPIGHPFSP